MQRDVGSGRVFIFSGGALGQPLVVLSVGVHSAKHITETPLVILATPCGKHCICPPRGLKEGTSGSSSSGLCPADLGGHCGLAPAGPPGQCEAAGSRRGDGALLAPICGPFH